MKTLTSLTCSKIDSLNNNDLVLISDSFPFLEELDLIYPKCTGITDVVVNDMSMTLPKLRKINLSGHYYINDSFLLHLCKNCEFLKEVVMSRCSTLTCDGIASANRERPSLRSLSVGRKWKP